MSLAAEEIKAFLEEKTDLYNRPDFIPTDPISVPHNYSQKEDIEIAGFFAATLAWGKRETIARNATRLVKMMGESPYDFVMSHREDDLYKLDNFVHRTFRGTDARYFVKALHHLYNTQGGMEHVFARASSKESVIPGIIHFHQQFFSLPHPERTKKHVSNPVKGSPAKRINMFLRWMVRKDKRGVDFGIWGKLKPAQLSCPLDLHSGNVARKLGLISARQDNLKALQELDVALRKMDPHDPVKYDFALFGLGIFEKF